MIKNLFKELIMTIYGSIQEQNATFERREEAGSAAPNEIIPSESLILDNGHRKGQGFSILKMVAALITLAAVSSSCNKLQRDLAGEVNFSKVAKNFKQTNLVSDTVSNHASRLDPTLVNAWGIAINPSGIFWINSNGKDLSEVFDKNGTPKRSPVTVPAPSGIVFNRTSDFVIKATGEVSKFIFASEDGNIYAWASGDSARTVVKRAPAVYKGLELANDGSANFLFATDFHDGRVDVFDANFNLVNSKPFADPKIAAGFAPFNIRLLGGNLFVTYAKQKPPENKDDQKGPGNGYVDIFKTDGSLLKRFITRGKLNSPWGIELAPEGFGFGKNVILVGNFGDGRINIFGSEEKGDENFLGSLKSYGSTLTIDGLWAITFPDGNVPGDNPDKLYFTAGPNEESHGLFGYIMKQ